MSDQELHPRALAEGEVLQSAPDPPGSTSVPIPPPPPADPDGTDYLLQKNAELYQRLAQGPRTGWVPIEETP